MDFGLDLPKHGLVFLMLGLRCKCAGNNASREKTCKEKCEEAFKYPCGDTADTNVFSIYTIENVPPSEHSQDNNRNCLLFFYNYSPGYNYYWDSCSATLNSNPALLCSNKYISEDNPMAKIHNRSDVIWAQAVENCIVARKFPASIQSIKNGNFTNQHEQDYWTGIIRKEYIISLNDMLDKSTNPPLTYAYVELINQTFYVRYADEGESRKSLCAGDSTSAGPMITTRETQSSYSESATTPTKKSTTGLAVGLSVSMALLIIVTIIVLMFLKRRGLPKKCYTRNGEKGNHNEDTKTEIPFVPSPILGSSTYTTNDLIASNHSYFVLEEIYKRETRGETEHYGEPDTTDVDHYDSIEMSQNDTFNNYDTTDGKKGPAMSALAEPYNIYNKVDLHQSNEYDHIQNGKPPKSDRQTEKKPRYIQ
ncbi:uncharacterized protein LOC128219821 [Mya arenaria]|uniref:uncharacterized protein LOC128219821 n=1 Tax=Mya arenaria TaxID=6604 RepID=UPI0022E2334E|nr:uncharacterized protein LOC128219821 [Mya arenaria]